MDTPNFDRIRFVTRHFDDLKGLRMLVPMGSVFFLEGLVTVFDSLPLLVLFLGIDAGVIFWIYRSRSYYQRRFGEVEPPDKRRRYFQQALYVGLLAIPLYFLYRGAFTFQRSEYVCLGGALLLTWLYLEQRVSEIHHLILGLLLLGLAAPVHSPSGFFRPELARSGMPQLLGGAAWVLAGLLDHWQLVRALPPLHEEDLAEDRA